MNENLKGIESTNTQLKNEYDLLKLRYENSENNYRKKILELEENKKKFHEIQTNFNFYNDKSNNSQMKLINNEKEKSEILNKEVDRLKIENKELIENNIILKEEIKKLIESNKLGRSFAKENKNIGQEEQMEILLKGYKEQMKVKLLRNFIIKRLEFNYFYTLINNINFTCLIITIFLEI